MRESPPTPLSSPIICSFNRSLFRSYRTDIRSKNRSSKPFAVSLLARSRRLSFLAAVRLMSTFVTAYVITKKGTLRSRWWASNDFLNRFAQTEESFVGASRPLKITGRDSKGQDLGVFGGNARDAGIYSLPAHRGPPFENRLWKSRHASKKLRFAARNNTDDDSEKYARCHRNFFIYCPANILSIFTTGKY